MTKILLKNNVVSMIGTVDSGLEFSHKVLGQRFYKFFLGINRLSNQKDRLPVIVSEKLINVKDFSEGMLIKLKGQYRSYNQIASDGKRKLILNVFARDIEMLYQSQLVEDVNETVLVGTICRIPIYRDTPMGRKITDILLAVNREYNKSDYIPCILWGRNAEVSANLSVGQVIKVTGRIQSRNYDKKLEDDTVESKLAYEVSVSKFKEIDKRSKE